MSEKKELSNEELEKVTGGCYGTDGVDTNGQFTGFISMYQLHDPKYWNKELYFIHKEWPKGKTWFAGKVTNSFEKDEGVYTNCTHYVDITQSGTSENHLGMHEIYGDNHACYTTKNF